MNAYTQTALVTALLLATGGAGAACRPTDILGNWVAHVQTPTHSELCFVHVNRTPTLSRMICTPVINGEARPDLQAQSLSVTGGVNSGCTVDAMIDFSTGTHVAIIGQLATTKNIVSGLALSTVGESGIISMVRK